MSFGIRPSRARSLSPDAGCPCGGGLFRRCCGPLLAGAVAPTAERLMRSRFTAFALGDAGYLQATWHPSTSPERLDLDDTIRWERLEILATTGGGEGDERGTVEFRAHWRDEADGHAGDLHETSRFRRAGERWWYVDGDTA